MKKMMTVVLVVVMLMMMSSVYAFTIDNVSAKPISSLAGTAANVLGILQWGGYIIAIGMLIWVGIKYVTAGAGEKAKAKETLIPIVIGAVLIAGAVTIAEAVFGAVD